QLAVRSPASRRSNLCRSFRRYAPMHRPARDGPSDRRSRRYCAGHIWLRGLAVVTPVRGRASADIVQSRRSSSELREEGVEGRGDITVQVFAMYDGVQEPMLQQEFGALEPLRQLLPYRLFDYARSGEADQGARLGDVQVAKHRIAGGHSSRGWIGEHGD